MVARSLTTGRLQRDAHRVAKNELAALIERLVLSGQDRLPSEDELSALLEVSRATVRSALLSLQKDGVVQRLHGRGTYINRHALRAQANISQDRAFAEILAEMGHEVVTDSTDVRVEERTTSISRIFDWEDVTHLCVIRRVFYADGQPAVFTIDHVPMRVLPENELPDNGDESIFDFLRVRAGRQVRYSVAEIVPTMPHQEVVDALNLADGVPVLLLEHTHVDESDVPVAFTQAYVNDKSLRFSVVRTYTNS
ncbi:GntR family transcriptional regulator [Nocardioides sp. LHD-245]|uniref:GntR family transcriptional regulator n=1 Tax=Nocardioides sp. LHD-245 TaxID=3051387 RepID=UPI0027DFF73E|nr:GntR family transcriptional regulator [Nocardioides sp. LHD-245]